MLFNHTNGEILYFKAEDRHLIRHGVCDPDKIKTVLNNCRSAYDAATGFAPIPEGVGLPLCVECATCAGLGLAHYELTRCDVCDGTGRLGSLARNEWYTCPACSHGEYAAPEGYLATPQVGGDEPCPDCDGWGMLDDSGVFFLQGVPVRGLYALRVIEPGAEFAEISIPIEQRDPVLAVAFRTPTATGVICGIVA